MLISTSRTLFCPRSSRIFQRFVYELPATLHFLPSSWYRPNTVETLATTPPTIVRRNLGQKNRNEFYERPPTGPFCSFHSASGPPPERRISSRIAHFDAQFSRKLTWRPHGIPRTQYPSQSTPRGAAFGPPEQAMASQRPRCSGSFPLILARFATTLAPSQTTCSLASGSIFSKFDFWASREPRFLRIVLPLFAVALPSLPPTCSPRKWPSNSNSIFELPRPALPALLPGYYIRRNSSISSTNFSKFRPGALVKSYAPNLHSHLPPHTLDFDPPEQRWPRRGHAALALSSLPSRLRRRPQISKFEIWASRDLPFLSTCSLFLLAPRALNPTKFDHFEHQFLENLTWRHR